MTITDYVVQKASRAKAAARQLATLSTAVKNKALLAMADALEAREAELLEANKKDLAAARGLSKAAVDRLTLNTKRIKEMAVGLREVAALPDPVGEVTKMWRRPNGMQVGRMRVPIGVIGIIYESRPNVTADAASLCLKSGNAVVLRGGSEAIQSNAAIVKVLSEAGEKLGLPAGAITFIDNPDRQVSTLLLKQDRLIDLIIPRGAVGLVHGITKGSTIAVIKHDKGVCHNDVDAAAVFVNASTRLHDGYQFGLGAEIGISTTRIHARGAMGLEELTSAKFIVLGTGQLRE